MAGSLTRLLGAKHGAGCPLGVVLENETLMHAEPPRVRRRIRLRVARREAEKLPQPALRLLERLRIVQTL